MSGSVAAALLVGGRSVRMGVDKAFLQWRGQILWKRQLGILKELEPAELLVCFGRREKFDVGGEDVRLVSDDPAAVGPMAGIAAALAATKCERVVVLAVDLPGMTAEFLGGLVRESEAGVGRVVERGGYFEGLAAIYPMALAALAVEVAAGKDPSVQRFVRRGIGLGRIRVTTADDEGLFRNLNSVSDLGSD